MSGKVVLFAILFPFVAQAGLSAKRPPNISWKTYADSKNIRESDSVYGSRKNWSDLDLNSVPEWDSLDNLKNIFFATRDLRFMDDPVVASFDRRISWLFPDDGCFARAAMQNFLIEEALKVELQRVFIFGALSVETDNAPYPNVLWWYHTTNMARIKDKIYVLDAAIEPLRPLTLDEWIERQHVTKESAEFSFCDRNAYDPEDYCFGSPTDKEIGLADEAFYLTYERERQTELGRDANEVLGEHPPWLQNFYNQSYSVIK